MTKYKALFPTSLLLYYTFFEKCENVSCSVLCDLMDCSLPGSSVPGILQARILEWVAILFSRGYSRPKD